MEISIYVPTTVQLKVFRLNYFNHQPIFQLFRWEFLDSQYYSNVRFQPAMISHATMGYITKKNSPFSTSMKLDHEGIKVSATECIKPHEARYFWSIPATQFCEHQMGGSCLQVRMKCYPRLALKDLLLQWQQPSSCHHSGTQYSPPISSVTGVLHLYYTDVELRLENEVNCFKTHN